MSRRNGSRRDGSRQNGSRRDGFSVYTGLEEGTSASRVVDPSSPLNMNSGTSLVSKGVESTVSVIKSTTTPPATCRLYFLAIFI